MTGFGVRPLALSIAVLCGLGACRSKPEPGAPPRGPQPSDTARDAASAAIPKAEPPRVDNVVLISVDALRADQPWSGYTKASTPNLSHFASTSIVYTQAYAVSNITMPALSGMLAGRYPTEIPRDTCIFGQFKLDGSLVPTLKEAGVATLAVHGHALFAGILAPKIGFDVWRLVRGVAGRLQTEGAVTGNEVADLLIDELKGLQDRGTRHFVWAHFVDPHDSYAKHKNFPPTSKSQRGLYDGEVAYTDAAIGRALDFLSQSDLSKNTAVIVTSDHGEAFGEHGTTRHGFSIYQEEIRVPLMLRIPGIAHREIDKPRSAIDLAPTIADLLRVKAPDGWRGVSLLKDLASSGPADRTVIVDVPENTERPQRWAVIVGSTKVAIEPGSVRVFDLKADPDEKTPLSGPEAGAAVGRAKTEIGALEYVKATKCMQVFVDGKDG